MTISSINGVALSTLSHIDGIAKTSLSAINGQSLPAGGSLVAVNRAANEDDNAGVAIASPATSHTTGNLLVVMIQWQPPTTTITLVADTAGNTWTAVGSTFTNGQNQCAFYYAKNITGNATNVITVTFSLADAGFRAIVVHQFSGASTTAPLGNESNGQGNSTAIATGSITVVAVQEVIVAFMEANNANFVAGTGYTLSTTNLGSFFADEYKIVTASEAATATCTSGPWYIRAVAFKTA